jgi:hypothetical protein
MCYLPMALCVYSDENTSYRVLHWCNLMVSLLRHLFLLLCSFFHPEEIVQDVIVFRLFHFWLWVMAMATNI